jgi:N-acetyl-anhydromuramyl-L-alanine amidase AmpD
MRVPGIVYVQGRNDYPDHDGRKYGIAIHNTSNNASDTGEASYASRRTDGVSSHFYVDRDSVTQSIDTDDRVGHAGSTEGNNNAIAVEITGGNGKTRGWWLENVAWAKLGAVLAHVIKTDPDYRGFRVRRATVAEMKTNPKIKAFYGHDDMRRAWGGTDHTDPGPNFPWDRLFQAVNAALGSSDTEDDDMLTPEARAAVRAECIAAMETIRPYQAGGPRARLKDPDRHPPKGWGDQSLRMEGDYLFEGALNTAKALVEVKLGQKAILAAIEGLDQDEVMARVEELAAVEAERDAATRLEEAARYAELLDLLDQAVAGGEAAADEVVRLIRAKLVDWASDDGDQDDTPEGTPAAAPASPGS